MDMLKLVHIYQLNNQVDKNITPCACTINFLNSTYQSGIQVALCGGPALRGHQSIERRKLLLCTIDGGHVVGRVALLDAGRHVNRPVAVLWCKCVDGDGFSLYAGLHKTEEHYLSAKCALHIKA